MFEFLNHLSKTIGVEPATIISKLGDLALAIVILVIGTWLVNRITDLFVTTLRVSKKIDETIINFLKSLVNILLKVIVYMAVASKLGFDTTSLVAIIGAAGLAVGLALQGSLANFAGGVLILFFKPFKVGDLIEAQEFTGHVQEIQIFVTKLLTPENKVVIIPNGALSNGSITNISEKGNLRVDLVVAVANTANLFETKKIILNAVLSDPKVLKDIPPVVEVLELLPDMVKIAVRPYATPEQYWDVYFKTLENVRIALNEHQVPGPIPTRIIINQN